jgi:hypothetical protein
MKSKLALSFVFSLGLISPFIACTDSVKAANHRENHSVPQDTNNSLKPVNSYFNSGNKTQLIAVINMEPLVIVVKQPKPPKPRPK